ncbi:MAG: hypothetical protein MUC65_07835 [Pontiellaceae bacterium]|nr:hypothetical protein [Pontiellaceae bacterium]
MKKNPETKYITGFLCLMAVLALFSRLWMLGAAAFRADETGFHKYVLQNIDIVEYWKTPPWLDQIPLNRTLSVLMVKLGLPPAPFVTRLPFALFGLLTLFLVWRFACRRFGSGAALFVLALALFNPYALYHAREAYHYSGSICFSMALFSVFWEIRERLRKSERIGRKLWTLWFAAAALACHMHMSVWIVTGLQALLFLIFGLRAAGKNKEKRREFLLPFLTGCILLGLVMSRWIYRAVQAVITQATEGDYLVGADARTEFFRLLPAYFAGENIAAVILLLIFAALTIRALFGGSGRTRRLRSLAWICALHFVAIMLYVAVVGRGVAKITYFSGVWAQFILLTGAGAYCGARALFRKSRGLCAVLQILLASGYILLTAVPDWAIIRLEGKPTPYYKINDWVQKNLPLGTPILTDRWWEPWNELLIHHSGGFSYTYTVPDEPLETCRQNNWRGTAEQFFRKYPLAAFLELQRGKYEQEFGKWGFPEFYFARSATITNEPALVLHRWKVLDFVDAYTNRVITRIYYNTREDLLALARRDGCEVLRFYGPGWGYIKPGYEQDDPEDYRILRKNASIELYNFKETPLSGTLRILAAPESLKIVTINEQITQEFLPGNVWSLDVPMVLDPGKNIIPFSSPSSEPLYVQDILWKTGEF